MAARRQSILIALVAALTLVSAMSVPSSSATTSAPRATPVAGQGPDNFSVLPGNYFSFPNRSTAEKYNIRNRVLRTINSVWGGGRTSLGEPAPGNGSIRIATWSFNDWGIAKALVAARNRGVTVQIVAAKQINEQYAPWQYLRRSFGGNLYRPGYPETRSTHTFARQCRGSCRGAGGTPHAKFFLFDNVGAGHNRSIVMQASMNLTAFAVQGQWNQAQVVWSSAVYGSYHGIFNQMAIAAYQRSPYRSYLAGNVLSMFFPKPGTSASTDPVMSTLNQVRCSGAQSGGTGTRTKIRVINYAIYDTRGTWLARKLRYLWNAGCDVAIIYSLSTRPVIGILRGGSGRGPIPMRQSVVTNSRREIVKYNHSKWMSITGNWGGDPNARIVVSGSTNWSNSAFGNDEQWQLVKSASAASAYLYNFAKTWRQSSSHAPGYGQPPSEGRVMAEATATDGVGGYAPGEQIPFGTGAYRYLTENGD